MGFANRAPSTRRTRTVEVKGQKLKVVSRLKTRKATAFGWVVDVGARTYSFHNPLLSREEVEERALTSWSRDEAIYAARKLQETAQAVGEPSAEELAWVARRDAREAARAARRGA